MPEILVETKEDLQNQCAEIVKRRSRRVRRV
jgi:hypothetical protein